jgi:RNA polymerase sigma-70 factor, ECF subfamily
MFWNRGRAIGAPEERWERSTADLAMERYADGEDAAFSELYDALAPRLYAFAMRQTGDGSSAEDVVQQTLLRMHRSRGEFVRGARVLPWAFAIARRLIIDGHRRRRFESPAEELPPEAASIEAGADELVAAGETAQLLSAHFERLSEPQREAFILVKQEGLSHAEAAEALGTTVTAIKLRVHRAYETLRLALAEGAQ